jgi:hypothetical protein
MTDFVCLGVMSTKTSQMCHSRPAWRGNPSSIHPEKHHRKRKKSLYEVVSQSVTAKWLCFVIFRGTLLFSSLRSTLPGGVNTCGKGVNGCMVPPLFYKRGRSHYFLRVGSESGGHANLTQSAFERRHPSTRRGGWAWNDEPTCRPRPRRVGDATAFVLWRAAFS